MSCKFKLFALALGMSICAPSFASLSYATGQDANNNGIDDQFTVNGGTAYLVTSAASGWPALPDNGITSGKYISWAADQSNLTRGGDPIGIFAYDFQFNWGDAAGATTFDFRWISDDYLNDVLLNGVSLGVNNIGASQPWTISNSRTGVAGNILTGLNTIEFVIDNSGAGPTGLAADFTIYGNATVPSGVPEPGSIALVGLGLALAASLRKRG